MRNMKMKNALVGLLTLAMTTGVFAPTVPVYAKAKTNATATIKKVTTEDAASATLTFKVNKLKKATYQVSTDKKFKKNVKTVKVVNNPKATTTEITGLNANTNYYVRVKGVLTTKGEKKKYKVKWSKVRAFKTADVVTPVPTPAPTPETSPTPAPTTETTPVTNPTTEEKQNTTPTVDFKLKQNSITLTKHAVMEASDLLPAGINPSDVTWKNNNYSVAGYEFGELYAEKIGTATITVTYKEKSETLTITVIPRADNFDGDFVLQKSTINVDLDDSISPSSVLPEGIYPENVTWVNNNKTIAYYDENEEEILPRSSGKATITLTYKGKTQTLTVIVGSYSDDTDPSNPDTGNTNPTNPDSGNTDPTNPDSGNSDPSRVTSICLRKSPVLTNPNCSYENGTFTAYEYAFIIPVKQLLIFPDGVSVKDLTITSKNSSVAHVQSWVMGSTTEWYVNAGVPGETDIDFTYNGVTVTVHIIVNELEY